MEVGHFSVSVCDQLLKNKQSTLCVRDFGFGNMYRC